MTSQYPGMEDHKVHPKGANIHKDLQAKIEEGSAWLKHQIKGFVTVASKKYTKVKFALILTRSEFAIGAYRNAGSKAFFAKLTILPGKRHNSECYADSTVPGPTHWLNSELSSINAMIAIFELFGGQIPLKFEE